MSFCQVGEFWQGLEAATNARQRVLFHRINGHLAVLARAIEATVGELLSVRLEAVPIRMEPPSAQTFHASLQDLLSRGQLHLSQQDYSHDICYVHIGLQAPRKT